MTTPSARPRLSMVPRDGTTSLVPGEARSPGPSFQDLVGADAVPAPPILRSEHYQFLGDADVPVDRYVTQAYFEREFERVWMQAWQWACREEHLPEAGDYYVYEVGEVSAIVARQHDGSIKAFVNSCLHRGTKLRAAEGDGHAESLRCPYHGWSWKLDGSLDKVPCAWDFPHVDPAKTRLPEVAVALWGGFVFLNFSANPQPFAEYAAPLPEHFARWDLSQRYVSLHMAKELNCNWKAAMEAFMESYHVYETHPQLLHATGDANVQYDTYGDHVSRFLAAGGTQSPHLEQPLSEQELIDKMLIGDRSMVGDELKVGEGETARSVMARFLRKAFGELYQADLAGYSDSEVIDTIEYQVFPNMILFPGFSLPMVYRFRPLGGRPDRTLFEILFLRPVPANGERPPPAALFRVKEEESYKIVPGMDPVLGAVYDQDTANLAAQQQGFSNALKCGRKTALTLGNYQEVRLRHFHQTLDRYLAR